LDELRLNQLAGVKFQMIKEKPTRWVILMNGPEKSLYDDEEFVVSIGLPGEYPFVAPTLTFMSPIQHPCVIGNEMILPMQQ